MKFITKVVTYFLAVLLVAYILPGVHVSGFWNTLIVALVLIVLQTILKPILVILTLPISFVTLGLFVFVINAFIIIIADFFVTGFNVDGFLWALIFSMALSIVVSIFESFEKTPDRKRR